MQVEWLQMKSLPCDPTFLLNGQGEQWQLNPDH